MFNLSVWCSSSLSRELVLVWKALANQFAMAGHFFEQQEGRMLSSSCIRCLRLVQRNQTIINCDVTDDDEERPRTAAARFQIYASRVAL